MGGLAFLSTLTSVNEQSGWLAFSHSANCWAFLRVGLLSVRYRHFVTSDPLVLGYRATVCRAAVARRSIAVAARGADPATVRASGASAAGARAVLAGLGLIDGQG